MKPPIKYFGGKGNMAQHILTQFPQNPYKIYIEPFGGGASLLLAKIQSPVEIYNDLEQNVYSLFKVLAHPESFQEMKAWLEITPFSEQLRREFKEELKDPAIPLVQRAYKFLYVNRTSINGIGGFMLNTYVRRGIAKPVSDYLSMIDRLPEMHQRLSNVIILNRDAFELMKKYNQPDTFFYLDPPYHWSTRTSTRYTVEMQDEMQSRFIDTLIPMEAKVLLSGYDNPEYHRLEDAGWCKHAFEVTMMSGSHKTKKQTECLWRNYAI